MKEQFINEVYAERELPVGQCPACGQFDVILQLISNCLICNEEIILWDKEMKAQAILQLLESLDK